MGTDIYHRVWVWISTVPEMKTHENCIRYYILVEFLLLAPVATDIRIVASLIAQCVNLIYTYVAPSTIKVFVLNLG